MSPKQTKETKEAKEGKEHIISIKLTTDVYKTLKHASVDEDKSISQIASELVMEKYGKKAAS